MVSYFTSVTASYRDLITLANFLNSESSNIFTNIVSFDDSTNTLWIILKRLDQYPLDFFIAVDDGDSYISCEHISVYNPYRDNDGIICFESEGSDCIPSTTIYSGSLKRVYIPWENTLSDFMSYAKSLGYPTNEPINICRIQNVCSFKGSSGLCNQNTLARISLSGNPTYTRIYIAAMYSNTPYIISIYEVSLR
jgi:hypothetical protein